MIFYIDQFIGCIKFRRFSEKGVIKKVDPFAQNDRVHDLNGNDLIFCEVKQGIDKRVEKRKTKYLSV